METSMIRMMTFFLTVLLAAGSVRAEAAMPATLPAQGGIERTLDALQERGRSLESFTGTVEMTEADTATGDEKVWSGRIWYRKDPRSHDTIRVDFNQKSQDGKVVKGEHIEYMLKDGFLTDRNYKSKKQVRRQVLKPGQKINLFKIGGPFPLPLGQDKEEVKREFVVTKVEPAKDDPAGSARLRLEPRKGTDLARRFKVIEIVVDPANDMPVRIDVTNANETETRITKLTELKINGGVNDSDFELEDISSQTGWDQIDEEYRG